MSSANSVILRLSKVYPVFKKVFLYYNLYIRNLKFFFKSSPSQFGEDKKIVKLFHKDKRHTLEELMELLDIHWHDGGYHYQQEQEQNREDAEIMLKNYWHYIQLTPVNALYTEYWFSFGTQFAKLNGKCDRIDLDDENNISIIDYKTSKRPGTERE